MILERFYQVVLVIVTQRSLHFGGELIEVIERNQRQRKHGQVENNG